MKKDELERFFLSNERLTHEEKRKVIFHSIGAEENVQHMHTFLTKIEEFFGFPLGETYLQAMLDTVSYCSKLDKALELYTKARQDLLQYKDVFVVPNKQRQALGKAMETLLSSFTSIPPWATPLSSVGLPLVSLLGNSQPLSDLLPKTFPDNFSTATFKHGSRSTQALSLLTPLAEAFPRGIAMKRNWEIRKGYPVFLVDVVNISTKNRRSLRLPLGISDQCLKAHPELARCVFEFGNTVLNEHADTTGATVTSFDEMCAAYNLEFNWQSTDISLDVVKMALFAFFRDAKISTRKAIWELSSRERFFTEDRLGAGHAYFVDDRLSLLPTKAEAAKSVSIKKWGNSDAILVDQRTYPLEYHTERQGVFHIVTFSINTEEHGIISVTTKYKAEPDESLLSLQVLELKGKYYHITGR